MNNINSIFTFIVAMICFLGSITIFILSFYYRKSMFYHHKNKNIPPNNNSNYANNQLHSTNYTLNVSMKDINNYNVSIKYLYDSLLLNKNKYLIIYKI